MTVQVLLDCCQSVPHSGVDVRALGADWIVASSHKFCGPTGMGFLWGRYEVLETMRPWMGGGEMIQVKHRTAGCMQVLGGACGVHAWSVSKHPTAKHELGHGIFIHTSQGLLICMRCSCVQSTH